MLLSGHENGRSVPSSFALSALPRPLLFLFLFSFSVVELALFKPFSVSSHTFRGADYVFFPRQAWQGATGLGQAYGGYAATTQWTRVSGSLRLPTSTRPSLSFFALPPLPLPFSLSNYAVFSFFVPSLWLARSLFLFLPIITSTSSLYRTNAPVL
jgi:hypothetical protein